MSWITPLNSLTSGFMGYASTSAAAGSTLTIDTGAAAQLNDAARRTREALAAQQFLNNAPPPPVPLTNEAIDQILAAQEYPMWTATTRTCQIDESPQKVESFRERLVRKYPAKEAV